MTKEQAMRNLTAALKEVFANDPAVDAARVDFEEVGLRITGISLQISVEAETVFRSEDSESDAEFLRSLRIAPDLSFRERRS